MRRSRSKVSFGAPPSLISSRNLESLPVPQVALRTLKPSADSAVRTTHKSDRHIRCPQRPTTSSTTPVPPTIVAVFSGMTVGDRPVSERRGSLVYCKSARDALRSGKGTDPMHGGKTIAARPRWTGRTDQPNQNRPRKKSLDPTHLRSRSDASHRHLRKRSRWQECPRKPTIRVAKSCCLQQKLA